jgi:hypothetical protein
MLVDELGVPVAPQKDAEIIEPGDETLQFDSIDQKNRDGGLGFPNVVEKRVLEVLRLLSCHEFVRLFGPLSAVVVQSSCARYATRGGEPLYHIYVTTSEE